MVADDEKVEYEILLKAEKAIKELVELNNQALSYKQKVDAIATSMKRFSAETGMSIRQVKSVFKELDTIVSDNVKGSALFGRVSKQGWDDAAKAAEAGSHKMAAGINVVRIALGVFVSELLFKAQQAIGEFFSEAIKQATQLEETMYRLANAERILSKSGQDISLSGLEEGITRIQKLLPIFSREDISQLVGQVAIGTQQLGYTEQQILDLTQAILLLNVQSVKQEDVMTTASHVMSAILGKSSQGIAALGISFNETEKKAAAMSLELLENGRTLQDLTDNEMAAVKLRILMTNANVDDAESLALLNTFLESNTAKIQENKSAWQDFLTTVGQGFANLIPDMTGVIGWMQEQVEVGNVRSLFRKTIGEQNKGPFISLEDNKIINKLFLGIKLTREEYEKLKSVLSTLDDKDILKIFPNPDAIKNRFARELIKSLIEVKDTATNTAAAIPELGEPFDTSGFETSIEKIIEDTANAREDLEASLSRKLEDLDIEYARKAEEAAINLQRKLEDIDRDYAREKESILAKQRREDEKAEAEYQLRLWELRMRFLMDLEDALHARDARQVIRLQKQYNLDKEALARKHALEGKERNESQKVELEDLEAKRRQRIEDAQREYAQKLIDQQTAKQRELDDLNTWYAREQADIELAQQRKMETLLKGWIDEKKITEDNAQEVYDILARYFGPGGMTDQLYQYMMQSLVANTVGAINQGMTAAAGSLNALYGLANKVNPFQGQFATPSEPSMGAFHGFAEGGTLLATRPTRALFGEGGPELVNFTPLNRVGKNINKVFSNGNSPNGVGVNGQIRVLVDLSPDLEGRIVEKSMDGVAEIVSKVGRMKA